MIYTGKNGVGKMHGFNALALSDEKVMIAPINSKGDISRCDMMIPIEEIDNVIVALKTAKEGAKK